jgi:hypothetical protein
MPFNHRQPEAFGTLNETGGVTEASSFKFGL